MVAEKVGTALRFAIPVEMVGESVSASVSAIGFALSAFGCYVRYIVNLSATLAATPLVGAEAANTTEAANLLVVGVFTAIGPVQLTSPRSKYVLHRTPAPCLGVGGRKGH